MRPIPARPRKIKFTYLAGSVLGPRGTPPPPSQESVIPLAELEPSPAEIRVAEEALEPRLLWRNGQKQSAPPKNHKSLSPRQRYGMSRMEIAALLEMPFVEQTLQQKRMVRDYRALANRNATIEELAPKYHVSPTAMEAIVEGWESDIIRKTCELYPKFHPRGSKPLNSRDHDERAENESEKSQDADIAKTGGVSIGGRVVSRGGKSGVGKTFHNMKLDTLERSGRISGTESAPNHDRTGGRISEEDDYSESSGDDIFRAE